MESLEFEEPERVRRRPPPAVVFVVALGLLVIGIVGAVTTTLLVVRQHHEDVVKLRRDPSYKYGYAVNPYNRTMRNAATSRVGCQEYLRSHPGAVPRLLNVHGRQGLRRKVELGQRLDHRCYAIAGSAVR